MPIRNTLTQSKPTQSKPVPMFRRWTRRLTHPRPKSAAPAFQAQTMPYIDAIYFDALCLTGNTEDASNLLVNAYLRAYTNWHEFQNRSLGSRGALTTLNWLYTNLHATFCDELLDRAKHHETAIGE